MIAPVRSLIDALFRRSRLEQGMDVELRAHIEAYTADLIRSVLPRAEAERRARIEFGGIEAVKERCREARGLRWPDELNQNLRYAFRSLRKAPGFTAAAVLSLAIGIGVNTAIFSVVSAALIRPLPYSRPDTLVTVCETETTRPESCGAFANANYFDLRAQTPSLADVAAHVSTGAGLIGAGDAEQILGRQVTGNMFALLGVGAALGRAMVPGDGDPGNPRVILLSHALWLRKFGGQADVVGRSLNLDGKGYTVIGVMPAAFRFPGADDEFWLPLRFDARDRQERSNHNLHCIGRLNRGVTLRQAQTDASFVARRLQKEFPATNVGIDFGLVPLRESLTRTARTALLVLLLAVALLLLIACANVGNLVLTRSTVRRRELAVRAALGAGRGRLVRQLLTESLCLSTVGGAAALCLCLALTRVMRASLPPALIPAGEIRVDAAVLCFGLLLSVAAGLLCGLAPALLVSRASLRDSLAGSSRSTTGSGSDQRTRSVLVAGEAALTVILLIGAGLLLRSFVRLMDVNPGFQPDRVLVVRFALPQFLYPEYARKMSYYRDLLERMKATPGIQDAALATCSPLTPEGGSSWFMREGHPDLNARKLIANNRLVSEDYFRTMGIPIREGRAFSPFDGAAAPLVAVINQSMARRFWPGESPVGKRFQFYNSDRPWVQIVGVAGDVRQTALNIDSSPEIYRPVAQDSQIWLAPRALVVRTRAAPSALASSVRRQFHALDPSVPIYGLNSMEALVDQSVASRKLEMVLVGVFGCVALLLASLGVYGVVGYAAAQRRQEMGIRMALGATRRQVTAMMLRKGLLPVFAGLLAGLALALPLTRFLSSELYQVKATDAFTFSAVSLIMAAVAAFAAFLPSRKASRIDPVLALRQE